jgi:hypothetical protein
VAFDEGLGFEVAFGAAFELAVVSGAVLDGAAPGGYFALADPEVRRGQIKDDWAEGMRWGSECAIMAQSAVSTGCPSYSEAGGDWGIPDEAIWIDIEPLRRGS